VWSKHSLAKCRELFAERCGGVCGGAQEPTPVPATASLPTSTLPAVAASPPRTVVPPAVEAPVLALTAEHLQPPLGQLVSSAASIRAWLIDSRNEDAASVDSDVENEWEIRDRMNGAQRYYYFSAGRLFFNWSVANAGSHLHPLMFNRASAERLNIRDFTNEDRPRLAITDCLDDAIDQAFGLKLRMGEHRLLVQAYDGAFLRKSFWCYTPCVHLPIRLTSCPLTLRSGMSASSSSTASTWTSSSTSRRS
jgi:hypothetical protein